MPSKANDPDDRLNQELARTTDALIERSRRLLEDLDSELNRHRPRDERRTA